MKNIKGSKTEQNIIKAFIGESMARNKYTFYASIANKEGFKKVHAVFEETANHEKEHAKRLFKLLSHDSAHSICIPESAVSTTFGTTSENLQAAANGENYEQDEMYPEFAKVAKEEGFNEIADIFLSIAESEKFHERRFLDLKKKIDTKTMFKNDKPVIWMCRNCGYHTIDPTTGAPEKCPACDHPQAHFQRA